MRRIAAIFLVFSYLLVLLQPILPRVFFSLNSSYIQQELCMQRTNAANTCKGACFMRKKLQAEQESNAPLRAMIIAQAELVQLKPELNTCCKALIPSEKTTYPSFTFAQHDQFVGDLPVPPPWA